MRLREYLHRTHSWTSTWLGELFLPSAVLSRLPPADRQLAESMHELLRAEIIRQLDARHAAAAARRNEFLLATTGSSARLPRPVLGTGAGHVPSEHDVSRARALALYRRDDELAELACLFIGQEALAAHMDPELVRERDPAEELWQQRFGASAV